MAMHDVNATWDYYWRISLCIGFLITFLVKLRGLRRSRIKTIKNSRGVIKLPLYFILIAIAWIGCLERREIPAIEAIALTTAGFLSRIEDQRSLRSSTPITSFLLCMLVTDVVGLRIRAPSLVWVRILAEVALFLLECRNKSSILTSEYQHLPPYTLAGAFDRLVFWWANRIIYESHSNSVVSAPALDHSLSSAGICERTRKSKGSSRHNIPTDEEGSPLLASATVPGPTISLMSMILKPLLGTFMLPIPSRLLLIVFKYIQPVLIATVIDAVNNEQTFLYTSGLIVPVAIITYVGLALSTSAYQHQLNRLKIVTRAGLVGLIHDKTLGLHSTAGRPDDGRVITLLNTDIEILVPAVELFHETWAHILEVIIGMTFLARKVGLISPILLLSIFGCSRVTRYVAQHLPPRQKDWNDAIQARLAAVGSLLMGFKSIRMTGLMNPVSRKISGLRRQEIEMSKRVRWIMVAYNASANALGIFSPMLVIVIFALTARPPLDAKTAFTTVAILATITHPANMIMTIIPRVLSAQTSIRRIEDFLREPEVEFVKTISNATEDGVEASTIKIERATFWLGQEKVPVLQNIDLAIRNGLVLCIGPVGSGKSTLCKAILGEVQSAGGISACCRTPIGYCAQNPWLPAGTVKDAIVGPSNINHTLDTAWYDTVVRACCLDEDLRSFSHGDHTEIGSRGTNLSGGQRQRLALARALYFRSLVYVLDDPFSALDERTESRILNNLFGIDGILHDLQKVTVFLVTNKTQHCAMATHIVILNEGKIQKQGPWQLLEEDLGSMDASLKTHSHLSVDANGGTDVSVSKQQNKAATLADAAIDITRPPGDLTIYAYYLRSMGTTNFLLLVGCTACYSVFVTLPQYWLKIWTENSGSNDTMFYVIGYVIISLIAWISTNGIMWSTVIRIAPSAGLTIHAALLDSSIKAHLKHLFSVDVGTILNRFSTDIQFVDRDLPGELSAFLVQVFKLSMQVSFLFTAQKSMAVTIPTCMIVVYLIQRFYIRASRQLRYRELKARGDLASSFLETIEGVITIRAFGWTKEYTERNSRYLDAFHRPTFMLLSIQRWLNVVLDLLLAAVATGIITFITQSRTRSTGADVGLSLNMVLLANTTLLRLVESYTVLEISLGAISRLKSYIENTPQESTSKNGMADLPGWPSAGELVMEDVRVSYSPSTIALSGINLTVRPGQRVVVYGRTGSGKSTLLLALLRLLELDSGSILVDGIDLSNLPRSVIRDRCLITVPQDPAVFLEETLRFNVDASGKYSDDQVMAALRETGLWEVLSQKRDISSADEDIGGILANSMVSLPSLTQGQLQLLSFSRAILRTEGPHRASEPSILKPIVLLDEATSSLDMETERSIYQLIQKHFTDKGLTVIMISHRLGAAIGSLRKDFDMFVEMDHGKIEQIGSM